MRFKIDTGANINIILTKTYKNQSEKHFLKPVNGSFISPGGIVQYSGKFITAIEIVNEKYLEIHVIKCLKLIFQANCY